MCENSVLSSIKMQLADPVQERGPLENEANLKVAVRRDLFAAVWNGHRVHPSMAWWGWPLALARPVSRSHGTVQSVTYEGQFNALPPETDGSRTLRSRSSSSSPPMRGSVAGIRRPLSKFARVGLSCRLN